MGSDSIAQKSSIPLTGGVKTRRRGVGGNCTKEGSGGVGRKGGRGVYQPRRESWSQAGLKP